MTDVFLQIIVLLRFVCFIALFYLLLHILASRLIVKPEHKILWFFSVLTTPLTRPVRAWVPGDEPAQRVRLVALVFYALLWLIALLATRMMAG